MAFILPQARPASARALMGVLPSFADIAVHDAWAPYDGYAAADHQLCCAHALRELQAVTDASPAGQWCWATQAADAITTMKALISEASAQGKAAADPMVLGEVVTHYHSAALIRARQTAGRSGKLMRKHNALAHRMLDRQDDYLRSPQTSGHRRITTAPSAISGWPS